MSNRQYPRLGASRQLPKIKFCPCGKPATYAVDYQVTWMRGEDEEVYRCDEHRKELHVAAPAKDAP